MDEAFEKWLQGNSEEMQKKFNPTCSITAWLHVERLSRFVFETLHSGEQEPSESPIDRARILAMGTEELWERVALDVMQFEQTHEVYPIHAYGRPAYRGSGYDRYPAIAWRPSVRGDQCFMVIDKMQELGARLSLDPSVYPGWPETGYRVKWLRDGYFKDGLWTRHSDLKTAILQAALCAIHGV